MKRKKEEEREGEREMERAVKREKERERERLRVEEEERRINGHKKEELKTMIQEIQEEIQAKMTGHVVTMLKTFLGDVGLLLKQLLKKGNISELYDERTIETAQALQVLHHFDLGESESDSDSEQRVSWESDNNTKGTGADRGINTQQTNTCNCGKAIQQYKTGRILYNMKLNGLWCIDICLLRNYSFKY